MILHGVFVFANMHRYLCWYENCATYVSDKNRASNSNIQGGVSELIFRTARGDDNTCQDKKINKNA